MGNLTKQLMNTLAKSGSNGIKELFRAQLELALNQLLKTEMTGFLGYHSYECLGADSEDCYNGKFKQKTLPAYARRCDQLENTIIQVYSHDVTTSEIAQLVEKCMVNIYTSATVSNISKATISDIAEFHQRELQDKYFFIFLNTTYINLRRDHVHRKAVAGGGGKGITSDDHK